MTLEVTILDQEINVITNEDGAVTVTTYVSEYTRAATQSEVNTGTSTTTYVSPSTLQDKDDTAVVLTDAATIDITGPKHTLSTALGRTFTISHAGDCMIIDITLAATSATFTFPATALCYFGSGSGDNNLAVTGATSGDHIMIGIIKVGSNYRVTGVNFGQ